MVLKGNILLVIVRIFHFGRVLQSGKLVFRWFNFTLKPPYTLAIRNFFLAIWDTSHWIFLSNLDSRQLMTSPRTLLGQF